MTYARNYTLMAPRSHGPNVVQPMVDQRRSERAAYRPVLSRRRPADDIRDMWNWVYRSLVIKAFPITN